MADQMFTMDRRARWSDSEVSAMLNIIYEMNVAKVLEAKRQRNKDIFKNIEKGMKELGYKKNWDQIRAKWKMLKSTYLARRKRTSVSHVMSFGEPSCKYFEQMDNLLQSGVNDSSDFNASDILEVIMNNEDESDNNSSSPREPPQPSPSCSTISNNSNSDSNIVIKKDSVITNNTTLEASQPSSSWNSTNNKINNNNNNNNNSNLNLLTKTTNCVSLNSNSTESSHLPTSCKTTNDIIVKNYVSTSNSSRSNNKNDMECKQSNKNLNNKKRKRSTPYEEALMKFQVSQAKLYRQLQREENEWMEKQLEKMQQHDERLMQAHTEQMKEAMRSISVILEPILQRSNRLTNNSCNQSTNS